MKIIDDKGRLFGLVNIIDLAVIIVIVAAAAAFAAAKLSNSNIQIIPTEKYTTEEITIMYLVQDVRQGTVDAFSMDDGLSVRGDNATIVPVGTITDIVTIPHQVSAIVDGEVIYTDVPDKFDIKVYTKVTADIYEDKIRIDNLEPRVGTLFSMMTRYVSTTGVVYSISGNGLK